MLYCHIHGHCIALVNRHSAGGRGLDVVQAERLLVGVVLGPAAGDEVVLQAAIEVAHANNAVDNGEDDEQNGDDGKGGERLSHGNVELAVSWLVDAHQLEDEVGETAEVEDEDNGHARLVLLLGEVGGCEQDTDGDGDRGNREGEFGVRGFGNNDDKLNDESEEEEKVEFEERNVNLLDSRLAEGSVAGGWAMSAVDAFSTYLVVKEPLLHAVISTNDLEDIPRKLLVELPGAEDHASRGESNHSRGGNEKRSNVGPQQIRGHALAQSIDRCQHINSHLNLVHLDGRVDEQGQVSNADANDLNRVLHAKRVPDDNQLVKEAKDEESEEGRDRLVLRLGIVGVDVGSEAYLELAKDVRLETQADDSLDAGDGHKGGRPLALEERHLVRAGGGCVARGEALAVGIALVVVSRHVCVFGIGRLRVRMLGTVGGLSV